MRVVYDIETLKSCFTYSDINIDTEQRTQFVLHPKVFQLTEFIEYLYTLKGAVGFNNLNFDYPIIHYIMTNYHRWKPALYSKKLTELNIIHLIYDKAQSIIEEQNKVDFNKIVAVKQKDWYIEQLDLFKIWHYNNLARSTSLKALEISMNYSNVMEMPIMHDKENISVDEIDNILLYNMNDVLATYEFYKKSKDKIELRKSLKSQFNIECLNWSDSKIGEQLILKLYSNLTGEDEWEVRQRRTYRNSINFNDCILDYIKFESKEFNDLLSYLKSQTITETKNAISKSVIYKGFKYVYGTGGIHGCIKSGIYTADDDYIIIDADVGSLYPNLAIQNGFFIEHLGHNFIEVYQNIIDLRMKAKKEGNSVLSDGFKLAANSVYGKSNDVNSFLYDPKFTMQITLNGQLLLTMLAETLVNTFGTKITILQINTDGITVKIPREFQSSYYALCKLWEAKTKLNLEYVEYSKMVISDVNNYLAVNVKGKVKHKGKFEVDKVVGSEPAYHKDNSFRIVPFALQEYFTKEISVEETIMNHRNIYDFCGRQKFTKDSYGTIHYLDTDKVKIEKQQKNVRYYISKPGAVFIKVYNKGTTEEINKGYQVTVFNDYIEKEWDIYNIDYRFYINECKKILEVIEDKQLELF